MNSATSTPSPAWRRRRWLLLILLVAAALRLVALSDVPPGLTHDEADHGLDAWGVVNGVRPLYFSVGYGREPLFDYATALVMAGSGPHAIAGRLTAAFSSLLLLAAVYAFTRRAFNARVALLTTAALAVSFWGVMSGRQALRSITLPALFTLAVAVYWAWRQRPSPGRLLVATLLLGATFYTYVPARALWLIFPALLLYQRLIGRPRHERGTLLMVAGAGALASPLLLTLARSGVETRLGQLDAPLRAAVAGDWGPLIANASGALQLFTFAGDPTWRYNLPGRPWLTPIVGLLFYAGIVLALWYVLGPRRRRHGAASFMALAWLLGGLAPVIVTGPELSMTQAIGLLPVLYLFPALALDAFYRRLRSRLPSGAAFVPAGAALLLTLLAAVTVRDYFGRWANAPEVRVQYETSLAETVAYLAENDVAAAAISTITPDQFHSPAVAFLLAPEMADRWRWFDGRHALVIPGIPDSLLSFSAFAPLNVQILTISQLDDPFTTLALRPDDQDQPVRFYDVDGLAWRDAVGGRLTAPNGGEAVGLGWGAGGGPATAVTLLGYDIAVKAETPIVIDVITMWQIRAAVDVPLVLFTHLIDTRGNLITQADRLDAPSLFWQAGDVFLQWHHLPLPPDLLPGDYTPVVGLYPADAPAGRLVTDTGGDSIRLAPVTVGP